jgi:hypothetical protein
LQNAGGCVFVRREKYMPRFRRDKENRRFYLLPGQGGSSHRRKRRLFLKWSVVTALIVSAIMAALMYWLDRF